MRVEPPSLPESTYMLHRPYCVCLVLATLGVGTVARAQVISSFEKSVPAPIFSMDGIARAAQVAASQGASIFASNALIGALGDADILLLRVNGSGTIVQDLVIGDGGGQGYHDVAREVVQTGKHYYITGYTRAIDTSAAHTFTALLIKVDTTLNFVSQRNYILPAAEMYGEVMTPSGPYDLLIGGKIYDGNNFNTFVMRVDTTGAPLWIRQYEIPFSETVSCMRELPGGDILLSGSVVLTFELQLPFVAKVGPDGDFLWGKIYNYPPGFVERSEFQFIHASSLDNIQLVGYTDRFGAGATDLYVVDIDSSGAVNWARTYGGPQFDEPNMAQFDQATNELVLVGSTGSFGSTGAAHPMAVRLSPDGLVLDAALYGDTGVYQPGRFYHSCRVGANNNLLMGSRDFPADDLYLVGADADLANFCAHHPVVLSTALQTTGTSTFTAVVTTPMPVVNDSALALSDFDGGTMLCDLPTSTRSGLEGPATLVLFPSPGHGVFQLVPTSGFVPTEVHVFDLQGRKVYGTTDVQREVRLPVGLDAGLYQVQVVDRIGARIGAPYLLH